MSRFVVTWEVGISQSTTAYVLPVPVAPATDWAGHRSIQSAMETFTTFIVYLFGESKPTADTFLGLGDATIDDGRCLFSAAGLEFGGGEEISDVTWASDEASDEET